MSPFTAVQNPPGCVSQTAGNCSAAPCSIFPSRCCNAISDRGHLLQVKAALGNPAFLASWDRYDAPCGSPRWEWVECNWDGRVSRLNFSDMGLSGTLPADLMMLSGLEVLDLSHNSIQGSLPDVPSGCGARLSVIDLSHNLLTGSLPATWRNLQSLKALNLSYNTLGNVGLSVQVRNRGRHAVLVPMRMSWTRHAHPALPHAQPQHMCRPDTRASAAPVGMRSGTDRPAVLHTHLAGNAAFCMDGVWVGHHALPLHVTAGQPEVCLLQAPRHAAIKLVVVKSQAAGAC